MSNAYNPETFAPPGWTIEEEMEERGMTQRQLADALGMSAQLVNSLLQGKAALSTETAIKLETVLDIPARLWLALESQYQLKQEEKKEYERLAPHVDIIDLYPIKKMKENKWIEERSNKVGILLELMRFFAQSNPSSLRDASIPQAAFRQKGKKDDIYAVKAWLRQGEIEGIKQQCVPYNKSTFTGMLKKARHLVCESPKEFVPQLIDLCAQSGVALVLVKELPNTGLCGAARWISPSKALIQLSLRYKTGDHFWFAFFHEACHILRHSKKELFVSNGNAAQPDEKFENEADTFASNILIPAARYKQFKEEGTFTYESVRTFAHEINTHPGIIVGRLQHDGYITYRQLNQLKMRLRWA